MQTPPDRSIRDHLAAYLASASSLDELKDWLVGATWDMDEAADPAATELVYDVKLTLADESSGIATKTEMDETLAALVSHDPAVIVHR